MPTNVNKIKIISVDFQKDFIDKKGIDYRHRKSVNFIKKTLVPFLRKKKIKVAEIISDYREIPLSSRKILCIPVEDGFESGIPQDIKLKNIWTKCWHSPIWVRKNIGLANKKPGKPYQDPKSFTKWLDSTIGKSKDIDVVVLIGLTVNCCILSLAQELYWSGYKVNILKEATDDYSGDLEDKENALHLIRANRWADTISWKDLKKKLR